EAGEKLPRNPEASRGHERESANQLVAGLDVRQQALHAGAQKKKTVGIIVLFANHDEPGFRVTLKNIGQKRASGGLGGVRVKEIKLSFWAREGSGGGGMRVNDVNLSFRRLKGPEVGRKRGFQLFGDNFELGLG